MRKLFFTCILFTVSFIGYSQDNNTPAVFPGGDAAWQQYLDTAFNRQWMSVHMTPKEKERFGSTQRVVYTFNVLSDGSIGLINIEGQVSQPIRSEVNRVLKSAPRWTPATLDGKASTYRKRQVSTFVFD
jgi:hypothetical protein